HRTLCLALALAATGQFSKLKRVYEAARALGADLSALREGALMTHLFGGFPRAIEAFRVLHEVCSGPGALPPEAPSHPPRDRLSTGRGVFERIYDEKAPSVLATLKSYSPTFEEAVLEDAYGRVLARPALDLATRERMAVCALTAQRLPRQLRSHMEGALRCGVSREELAETIELAEIAAEKEAVQDARSLLASCGSQ
ncbi:MAG: carboxymuconolactone decarboxylase family protein, partial [Planctomycetota bacterium]